MTSEEPRIRATASLPAGMTMKKAWDGPAHSGPGTLEITRRWLRGKHFVLLLVAAGGAVGLAYLWQSGFEPRVPVIVGALMVGMFTLRLVPMFTNTTRIRATADRVDVTHGPLPTIMWRNQSVSAAQLKQLFVKKLGPMYEVGAELDDGSQITLVRPLVNEQQAVYVEQTIEAQLGITDVAVEGEIDVSGKPVALGSGAGGAAAFVPIMIILGAFVMFAAFGVELEGSFVLSGDLGNETFTPDNCESGQLSGYNGAELLSSRNRLLVVRAIRDPTRGTLLAIERAGQSPIVVEPASCKSLHVRVERNGNVVNDVYAVEGSATADCPNIKGTVKFDGCH